MKKNNLKIVKIDKSKSLFNYEKKILINELILDLKLGYYDFEKVSSLVNSADFLKVNLEELELINQLFKFNISDTQNLIFKIYHKLGIINLVNF